MAAGFLDLPSELVLRIVDFLSALHERSQEEERHETATSADEDEQMRSTEHLVPEGLKAGTKLAQTCTGLRSIVAPQIYKKVYLTNTESCGESINLIANGPFRSTVKELVFVGRAPGEQEEGFDDVNGVMPKTVEDLLSHLAKLFPQLEALNVGFALDLSDPDKWDIYPWEDFMDGEDEAQVSQTEENQAWRALMNKTWAAIARNGRCGVKYLKMRHIIPKMVSAYSSTQFHELLSGIEKFEMSVWGMDNGAGWHSSTQDGYLLVLEQIDAIFAGLSSCTDFTLTASEYCYIGLRGMRHVPLRLLPPHMPQLKRLTLAHCFASPELVEFLKEHRDVLEEVFLHNCSASPSEMGLAENGIDWQELFESMHVMTKLKTIEVLPVDIPYSYEMLFGNASTIAEDKQQIKEVGSALSAGQGRRRLFMYGTGNCVLAGSDVVLNALTRTK